MRFKANSSVAINHKASVVLALCTLNLVERLDALGAQVLANQTLAVQHLDALDIGLEGALGAALRVADIVPDHADFAAIFTLHEFVSFSGSKAAGSYHSTP
jgi:hypothetical protein